MRLADIDLKPTHRKLRQFAALWLVIVGTLAIWNGSFGQRPMIGAALGAAAVTFGVLGLAWPLAVRWLFVGMTILALPIGWVVSHLLLALVYYGIFTPLALLFRLIGRDALHLRGQRDAATYWQPRPATADVCRYFRQF